MAISNKDCTLLFYSKTLNVSFDRTLMLGRLMLNASREEIANCVKKYANTSDTGNIPIGEYSEPLFKILGATQVESLDYSDYEGASLIHDMNLPVKDNLHSKFSALIDGGTLEHIFNFPVAIANCMNMLTVGGHFIGISPANNQMGHGFYQFSPELYYRVFSKQNGFLVKKLFITTTDNNGSWYEVSDPALIKSRVMITNNYSLSMVVIAQKISEEEIFKVAPQQSDYLATWEIAAAIENNTPLISESKAMFFYRKYFPKWLKIVVHYWHDFFAEKKIETDELGIVDSNHFKKIEF